MEGGPPSFTPDYSGRALLRNATTPAARFRTLVGGLELSGEFFDDFQFPLGGNAETREVITDVLSPVHYSALSTRTGSRRVARRETM